MIRRAAILFALWPFACPALTLEFPQNARMVDQTTTADSSYDMPTGPWTEAGIPTERAEGEVRQQIWQIDAPGVTTLQILSPLRQQLRREGYDILFDCTDIQCGGFDFRFGTLVAAAPDFLIDLGDYRYMAARRNGNDGEAEVISLLISRTAERGFVQVIRAGVTKATDTELATTNAPAVRQTQADGPAMTNAPEDFRTRLEETGHAVLDGLNFESGSAQLGPGPYDSLRDLADYLRANPSRTVALVGHTDASGSLEANISLSKLRAGSVLERLVAEYTIPRSQLDAQGMGYLAPLTTNLTQEGREANRRVEVILTSTE